MPCWYSSCHSRHCTGIPSQPYVSFLDLVLYSVSSVLSIPIHYHVCDLVANPPVLARPAQDREALCKDMCSDSIHEQDEEHEACAGILPHEHLWPASVVVGGGLELVLWGACKPDRDLLALNHVMGTIPVSEWHERELLNHVWMWLICFNMDRSLLTS